MDTWLKVGSAVLMGAMIVLLLPRAREMLKNGVKGSTQEWISALIPLGLVIAFVMLLVQLV